MATLVSRLTSSGTLFVNGSFDEITKTINSADSGTVYSSTFDEVSYNPNGDITGYIAYTAGSLNPNLLLNTVDPTYSGWNPVECTLALTTATTAPDGTLTAWKFIESTTPTVEHWFYQYISSFTVGQHATFSFYAKAAERSQINLRFIGSTNLVSLTVDLLTGALLNPNSSPNGLSYSVTPADKGWWRISATGFADGVTLLGSLFIVQTSPNTTSYTGDGTSGLYLWGQQLQYGDTADSYVPTGATGAIATGTTNLFYNTRTFSNWGLSGGITTATTATLAPDGSVSAYKLIANAAQDPNAGSSTILSQQNGYGQVNTGSIYTQSIFFKAAEFNTLRIRNNSTGEIYDFTIGTTPSATSGVLNPQLDFVDNGWYRASWSFVANDIGGGGGRADNWSLRLASTGDGTSGVYIWGPQLQAGYTLSPYIAIGSTLYQPINNFTSRNVSNGKLLTIGALDEITERPIVTNGLVLNLDAANPSSFNGGNTWRDLTGLNGDFTIDNAPTGLPNQLYFSFNGTNQQVKNENTATTTSTQFLGTSLFSFGIFFRVTASLGINQFGGIFRHENTLGGGQRDGYNFLINSPSTGSWSIGTERWVAQANISAYMVVTEANYKNTWHYATGVYNGTNMLLYMDAVLQATSGVTSSASIAFSSNFYIGSDGGYGYVPIDISTIHFYNRVLSVAEIQKNYNALKNRYM